MAKKIIEDDEEEEKFKDDFDEDDFDEEPKKKKPQKEDDLDEEIEDEEEEEDKKGRDKVRFESREAPKQEFKAKKKISPSMRYSAYHLPERAGVKDNTTDESIGEDINVLLAKILNDLEDIKIAIGA